MLKLRKNKKGFTLVELIVVIAIMAVLAGTVAGVTVSQLNKNTDKANYTQANKIATTISGLILEDPDTYINAGTGAASDTSSTTTTPTYDTFKAINTNFVNTLTNEFQGKTITETNAPGKGEFGVYVTADSKYIVVCFGAKTNDYKKQGYIIDTEGVVKPVADFTAYPKTAQQQ